MQLLTPAQMTFAEAQRTGHLATADRAGRPHVVPVCYAHDGASFYVALDAKPKRVAHAQLKRVRNILANPQAALVIDRYSDDWGALAYLLLRGVAALLPPDDSEHIQAVALLRQRAMLLPVVVEGPAHAVAGLGEANAAARSSPRRRRTWAGHRTRRWSLRRCRQT